MSAPCQHSAGSVALQATPSLTLYPFIDIVSGLLFQVLFMDHPLESSRQTWQVDVTITPVLIETKAQRG